MFSSKSICDNMITGRSKKNPNLDSPKNGLKKVNVAEIKNINSNDEKTKVEIIDGE